MTPMQKAANINEMDLARIRADLRKTLPRATPSELDDLANDVLIERLRTRAGDIRRRETLNKTYQAGDVGGATMLIRDLQRAAPPGDLQKIAPAVANTLLDHFAMQATGRPIAKAAASPQVSYLMTASGSDGAAAIRDAQAAGPAYVQTRESPGRW